MKQRLNVLFGVLLLSACGQKPPQPPADVKKLMLERVQPTAVSYWDSVSFVSDAKGEHDVFPSTPAEWERTRKAAADLGALGKLLQSPEYSKDRGADWQQFAGGLAQMAQKAELAALSKDKDRVFQVGGEIYNVCSACHEAYRKLEPSAAASPNANTSQ